MDQSDQTAIPMTILTGFLGAGKTTLLNRILTAEHGLRVAVLVNDFGSLNIDAELVVSVEEDVISLSNGCVCCSLRDDLVATVLQTIDRPEAPEYILLEASGVSDPAGIAMTFMDEVLRERVRLDSITCVVDAQQVLAHPEHPGVLDLITRQVGFSDLVILNKADLADKSELEAVEAWIEETFRRVRVIRATRCNVPLEVLLAVGRFDPARWFDEGMSHGHSDDGTQVGFNSSTFEYDRPLSMSALGEAVKKAPSHVYRIKGILFTSERPDERIVINVVGRRMDVSSLGPWAGSQRKSQMVAISSRLDDAAILNELFESCWT